MTIPLVVALAAPQTGAGARPDTDEFTAESEPARDLLDPGRCLGAAFGGDEPEFRANCLAICDGDDVYTVISRKRKIKNKAHWCEYMAHEFCIQRDRDYGDWCWGTPERRED